MAIFGTDIDSYTYVYAVKLKNWSNFSLFKVKNWSILCFLFLFLKISFSLQKGGFLKNKQKTTTKTHFLKLKTGPIMLRDMLGPFFNFNLDQMLTLDVLLKPLFL